jgi:hypothetical protein
LAGCPTEINSDPPAVILGSTPAVRGRVRLNKPVAVLALSS